MHSRRWKTCAALALATTLVLGAGVTNARAESMLVTFKDGILCDSAGQVEEVIQQHGQKPLVSVLDSINARTGKMSCGTLKRPMILMMEPIKIVSTPGGRMAIVKLTTRLGLVQFTWRRLDREDKEEGQPV